MRSVPKGRCGPCFSRIPKGSTQVPCDFSRALTKSPAVSSSHLTGSDCAEASAAETSPKTATREINELSIGHLVSNSHGTSQEASALTTGFRCRRHVETTPRYNQPITGGFNMAAPSIALAFRGFEVLERTPGFLRGILTGLRKEELDWQPSPERWSISMVLAHLADAEVKGFVSRFRAIADQDNPFLPSYDQLELFKSGKKFDGLAELDKFDNLRRDTLALLRSLPPEVGKRSGK